MLKGQLSRVPWPGNFWLPFIFQPALRALQRPHKHSHSVHHTFNMVYQLFLFCFFLHFCFFCCFLFKSKRISSKYRTATSNHWNGTWKGC